MSGSMEPLSGDELKAKVTRIKRKRIIGELKIAAVFLTFFISILIALIYGQWLFAGSLALLAVAMFASTGF